MADYQDGAIAEGPNGAYLVYRGGSWYPAQQDGRPLERIPRPDYGSNHFQLPNGDIVRQGPRGGQETVENFGGGSSSGGGGALVGADARGRYNIGIESMVAGERKTAAEEARGGNPMNRDWGAVALDSIDLAPGEAEFRPFAPLARVVGGQDYQSYNQGLASYEASLMPIMSGASVTASEARRMIRADFPAVGDTEETIKAKAQNRQRRMNAVAAGLGREAVFSDAEIATGRSAAGVGETDSSTGLPTYPGIAAAASGISEIPAPEGGYGPGPDPEPIDLSSLSDEQKLALVPGAKLRLADGSVVTLSGAPTRSPTAPGDATEGGVNLRPQTADETIGERRDMNGGLRRVDAAVRGAADTLTFGFADEIAAGLNTALPLDPGARFGDYRHNIDLQRGIDRADAEDVPVSRAAGQVAGGVAGLAAAAPRAVATGAPMGAQVARGARAGALYGGAYGAGSGEGSIIERAPNALLGAGAGAAFGAAAPPVANAFGNRVAAPVVNALQGANRFAGRQVGRAGTALGVPGAEALVERAQPNVLAQAVDRFAQRAPQDVNALSGNVSRLRAEAIEPTLADAVNDGGRGVLRANATRQTPARQAAREFADGRAAGLQDRVSTQARRTISDDPRSPLEMTGEMTARRGRQADEAFGAVRGDMVSPDRGVLEALRTPAMRPAIEEAMTSALNRGDQETAGLLRNLTDDALEYGADAQITVGMADRISRALNGRAEAYQRAGNNDQAASHFALAERLRGSARGQSPGYDSALSQFADESGKIDAVALGENFMSMEADQFAAAVAKLSPEERQIVRASARRAVERAAGTQGQAPGVAQRLSSGREQTMRSQALLGDAEPMQRAMSAEREVLRNAQAVNPSAGSQTSLNLMDQGAASGVMGAVRSPVSTAAKVVLDRIASRGFSDQQAQAIVEAAIDPRRTDEVIGMLAERMSRREARNLARSLTHQATRSLQSDRSN